METLSPQNLGRKPHPNKQPLRIQTNQKTHHKDAMRYKKPPDSEQEPNANQRDPTIPSPALAATNGQLIQLILNGTVGGRIEVVPEKAYRREENPGSGVSLWQMRIRDPTLFGKQR